MPKWLKYSLLGLGGFLFFMLIMTLAMNMIDQKLRPEVQAILDKPRTLTESQMNAYFTMLGGIASDEPGEEERGRALWEKRKEPGFWTGLAKLNRFDKTPVPGCKDVCTAQMLKDDPKLQEGLKEGARELKTYLKMIENGEGATPFDDEELNVITGLPFTGQKLLWLQMAEWLGKGGELRVADSILASNHYAGSFIRNGNLFERVVGSVILRGNAAFTVYAMKTSKRFRVTQELVDSFNFPRTEDILYGAMDEELRAVNRMVHMIKNVSDLKMMGLGDSEGIRLNESGKIPASLFFRPNETLNRYYDISSQSLTTECPPGMDLYQCVPAAGWARFKYPWNYLRNPVGRGLVMMMMTGVSNQRHKLEERRADIIAAQDSMRLAL